jgi:hypothetical protein
MKPPRFITVTLVGVFYTAVGLAFAWFGGSSEHSTVVLWRRLAWIVSAVGFVAHIAYEHHLRGGSARMTAVQASMAAAIGAFGLAAAANLHGLTVGSANQRALRIALLAWPVVVAVPAFIVAMIASALATFAKRHLQNTNGVSQ